MDAYNYYLASQSISLAIWLVTILIVFGIAFICAYVVYNDARRTKRMPAIEWALISFLLPILGILIYFTIKNSKKR